MMLQNRHLKIDIHHLNALARHRRAYLSLSSGGKSDETLPDVDSEAILSWWNGEENAARPSHPLYASPRTHDADNLGGGVRDEAAALV